MLEVVDAVRRRSRLVAGSSAIATSSPGRVAGGLDALRRAAAAPPRWSRGSGAKPPSSPTAVARPRSCSVFLSAWKTSVPHAQALARTTRRRTGTTMNSWKSTELSAWAPPLRTFIIGTGSTCARLAAEVAPQRQALLGRGRVRGGQRHAEDRVGAEARLVRRAVELDQLPVEPRLVGGVEAGDRLGDLAVDVGDGLRDALAAATRVPPSRSSVASNSPVEAPDGTAARPAAPERRRELDLDGRVAARVEDLAGVDVLDLAHGVVCPLMRAWA